MMQTMPQTPCCIKLKNRGLIRVEGEDRQSFLQGLVSVDLRRLAPDHPLYGCFLTPQGKFLHDFFMIEREGETLLECEGGARAQDFFSRLRAYCLRRKVSLSVEEDVSVYAILGENASREGWYKDPRHEALGFRSLKRPEGLTEAPFEVWDALRILLCVPDGSRDLEVGLSTLDEGNLERMGAVSYDKGCYLGQELTARMHYRGLGKKHLQVVSLDALPEGAELRSSCGDVGLALVRSS